MIDQADLFRAWRGQQLAGQQELLRQANADTLWPDQRAAVARDQADGDVWITYPRGVGGEEIPDMLKRFDQAVVANKPDLVLWQPGTRNAS